MNINNFFTLAKEKGLEAVEIVVSRASSTEMGVYEALIENYTTSTSILIQARGIYKGKMGYAISEKDDKTTPHYLIGQIKDSASVSETEDLSIIFPGSPKYKKKTFYNKQLPLISEKDKIALLLDIEKAIKAASPLISDVETVGYSEESSETKFYNSYGLKLTTKSNYYVIMASVVAKNGEDVKTEFKIKLDNDFAKFDKAKFVKEIVADVLAKLGGEPCISASYPIIFDPSVTGTLLGAFLSSASAEAIEKKTSLFGDKLGKKVASNKVTILDAPLNKNIFYTYFDDEGVAKINRPLIKNGVLQTYLHNLSTATKMGVEPTGHGRNTGGKIGVGISNIVLKPGKEDLNGLMSGISEGLIITDLMGVHSGLNTTSGDFSLQASGFMIENGKKTKPVNLITVAGNLMKLFKDIVKVGNENELLLSSFTTSSILVKSLNVSGK